jgi:hypothetical protein
MLYPFVLGLSKHERLRNGALRSPFDELRANGTHQDLRDAAQEAEASLSASSEKATRR